MKELQFVAAREADWVRWDRWLGITSDTSGAAYKPKAAQRRALHAKARAVFAVEELSSQFRQLCHDLSLARDRNYSSVLVDALQYRVLAAHQRLYGARPRVAASIRDYFLRDFPRAVRREWVLVLTAALLFFGPLITTIVLLQYQPDLVYLFVPPVAVERFEKMYTPGAMGHLRGPMEDVSMYAFYIGNNVKINFQCFAGGLFFGIGSVFYLLFNGAFSGAIAGHLTQIGLVRPFWSFVAGHSSFELIGIVFSGTAGLKLGAALIAPGRRTRRLALLENTRVAAPIIYGAATLTFLAAFFEAFWSPLGFVPATVKYVVGITLWIVLIAYFCLMGRRRPDGP